MGNKEFQDQKERNINFIDKLLKLFENKGDRKKQVIACRLKARVKTTKKEDYEQHRIQ